MAIVFFGTDDNHANYNFLEYKFLSTSLKKIENG